MPILLGLTGFHVLKSFVAMSLKIRSRTPNFPDLSKPMPTNIRRFNDVCEHFDFGTFGDNICRSGAAIDEPLTGRTGKGREICVD